ncbi:class I SAM-dependent methyltransferase [uncultured Psychroserpens sp.]|uniref:class I SAM-dependent methyltransferase n=1 Tax=uncultured Psychroserpens sp. TaxID=255436 RepID=UPI0026247A6C|nr:class I SAM-dependent methyltransferase [uncultured Psychroserpens sp.]
MNTEILNKDIQDFINKNLRADVSKILLRGTPFKNVSTRAVVEQIESKLKSEHKLPSWFSTPNIYFPNKLNIEQTSSEIAAKYKSELFTGTTIVDITGGLGVDSYYFSKVFKSVIHCEINETLSQIVSHNNEQFEIANIATIAEDGIEFLKSGDQQFDWIYVDPSRRHDSKGKVFFLNDCLPNVPEHLETLFKHAPNIAIKTSPLLDLSVGLNELKHVKHIHVLAIKNEVKELLWILENGFEGPTTIKTVNIVKGKKDIFSFRLSDESQRNVVYSKPLRYLFEPNSSILKSGGFNSLAESLKLSKLHQHSHLYTSDMLIEFPGRSFKIETVINYNKKALKSLGISKGNITTRNFPETVQQLRKKHRIKDGGNTYIFFTTNNLNEKIVIVSSKIN